MANAIVTIRLMPRSPEEDLSTLEVDARAVIERLGGVLGKTERTPVAFGLIALKLYIVIDERKGTQVLETELGALTGVSSAEVLDFRRAVG